MLTFEEHVYERQYLEERAQIRLLQKMLHALPEQPEVLQTFELLKHTNDSVRHELAEAMSSYTSLLSLQEMLPRFLREDIESRIQTHAPGLAKAMSGIIERVRVLR